MMQETQQTLRQLGVFLCLARKRRGWRQSDTAARIQVSVDTIKRAEQGDAGVKTGTLLDLLALYSRIDAFAKVIDPNQDLVGISVANEGLPKRVSAPKYRRS